MASENFPHDAAYKTMFSNPEMVASLLEDFVPEDFIRDLDLSTLEKCNCSYTGPDFQERHDDLVWRLRWKDQWFYICILLEFQSGPDHWMALRILTYTALFWCDLVKRGEATPDKPLPPVLPIVVYNGTRPWHGPLETDALIAPHHPGLAKYQPVQQYCLLDVKRLAQKNLNEANGPAVYIFRGEQAFSADSIVQIAQELMDKSVGRGSANWQDDVLQWLELKIRKNFPSWLAASEISARKEGPHMFVELFREHRKELDRIKNQYIEEGLAEGRAQGLAKGLEEGLVEGRAKGRAEGRAEAEAAFLAVQRDTLLELLSERFGTIDACCQDTIAEITNSHILKNLTVGLSKVDTPEDFKAMLARI